MKAQKKKFLVISVRGLYPFRKRSDFRILAAESIMVFGPRENAFVTDRAGLLELRFAIDEALRKAKP